MKRCGLLRLSEVIGSLIVNTSTVTNQSTSRSLSPTLLLRISDGHGHIHRAFNDFGQAQKSAEAFAGAGYNVAMISATGRYIMGFDPTSKRAPR